VRSWFSAQQPGRSGAATVRVSWRFLKQACGTIPAGRWSHRMGRALVEMPDHRRPIAPEFDASDGLAGEGWLCRGLTRWFRCRCSA
jgi:hypothetical protein